MAVLFGLRRRRPPELNKIGANGELVQSRRLDDLLFSSIALRSIFWPSMSRGKSIMSFRLLTGLKTSHSSSLPSTHMGDPARD